MSDGCATAPRIIGRGVKRGKRQGSKIIGLTSCETECRVIGQREHVRCPETVSCRTGNELEERERDSDGHTDCKVLDVGRTYVIDP